MEPDFVPEEVVEAIRVHQGSMADSEVKPSGSKSDDDFQLMAVKTQPVLTLLQTKVPSQETLT